MNKTLKKTLSVILTILMIVSSVPFAIAADETPDFSDAQEITSVDGKLYFDGVATSGYSLYIPSGKYKLVGDIFTQIDVQLYDGADVTIDLNGYEWDLSNSKFNCQSAVFSIYDTSEEQTGRIVSSSEILYVGASNGCVFNLYGGTVESTGTYALYSNWSNCNLYGGKIKSNGYALFYYMIAPCTINLDGTVIECGEGYSEFSTLLTSSDVKGNAVIDVADYNGGALSVDFEMANTLGKITFFKGIENAEEAEKYTVNATINDNYGLYLEKEEYDEATGEKSIYTAKNAFTQQPAADNNYTVEFNNPAATSFQWYEIEETVINEYELADAGAGYYSYKVSVDVKAGDIVKVSTDSDYEYLDIYTNPYVGSLSMDDGQKVGLVTFNSDVSEICVDFVKTENPIKIELSLVNETALDGETGKTLQNGEYGKAYWCKATVGTKAYASDIVVVHDGTECPHDNYTNGVCDNCKYVCPHSWGEGVLTRPTFVDNDGLLVWKEGYYTYTCTLCGDEKTETVECAEIKLCDDLLTKVINYSLDETLTEEATTEIYQSYQNFINNNSEILDQFYFIRNDLIASEQGIVDEAVAELQEIVDAIEAKIASGEYVKADYTEIDEVTNAIDEALENATISDEMANELADIKADLEALKGDINTSKADLENSGLLDRAKAITETMNNCADGNHTDEDGDYECDYGCGHEFEKPVDPTPDTPDEPEQPDAPTDDVCEDCGKVHNGFISGIICFFTRIINFIKNLFA